MSFPRLLRGALTALAFSALSAAGLAAQGVTTGAVTGRVTDESGAGIDEAQVEVRNPRTGLNLGAVTRSEPCVRSTR